MKKILIFILALAGSISTKAQDIEERTRILDEVVIMPDTSGRVNTIMGQVARRARENRARMNGFTARANAFLYSQDMDFIPQVMPGKIMFLVRMAARLTRHGALLNYALEQQKISTQLYADIRFADGKATFHNKRVVKSTPDMPRKVQEQLLRTASVNPYDVIYGEGSLLNPKNREKYDVSIQETIQEDGETVKVLAFRNKNEKSKETILLHIVEGDWGIKHMAVKSRFGSQIMDCTNVGNGIYLPTYYALNPNPISLDDFLAEARKKVAEAKEKPSRMTRKTLDRLQKVVNGERKYYPRIEIKCKLSYYKR